MADYEEMKRFLAEEYGIQTEKDLERAIAGLGPIDLSPFCGEVVKTGRRVSRNEAERTEKAG